MDGAKALEIASQISLINDWWWWFSARRQIHWLL